MSHNTTVRGTARQHHTTPQGVKLQRGYAYLPAETWERLYALAKAAGCSASQYIEILISTAESGKTTQGFNNDSTDHPASV
uniref:hypothetical protein n=1 Tax=Cupriavidus taiwanensis TaxID=164546 RepID=UPI0011C06402|nr:hypothetical protein [Cupriavidus taiwanensis]